MPVVQPIDDEKLRKLLVQYCYGLTGSSWDAEDLAQDTFAKAMPFMKSVNGLANPSAYLLRMARNRWIDQVRRKKRGQMLEKEAALAERSGEQADSIATEQAVKLLLRRLTPLQYTVFMLRDAVHLSAKETASMLGLSEGAVKASLHRARAAVRTVRQLLREEADEPAGLSTGEEEQPVVQAYVLALQNGDAQAIASLMLADEGSRQIAALQVRQQLEAGAPVSQRSGAVPKALRAAA